MLLVLSKFVLIAHLFSIIFLNFGGDLESSLNDNRT